MAMSKKRCLYCYEPMDEAGQEYHDSCSRKFFASPEPPELPYSEDDMRELAAQVVRAQLAVTGVQAKLSLTIEIEKLPVRHRRFTIVGLWGAYILKPPSPAYPFLPEVEDATMHLAALAKLSVVPHSLIRMKSGALAYITRRIDRKAKTKLHMEDMCQLTGRLTEHKYHGSHEQIARTLRLFSSIPGLDVIAFYEQVLFSFLTGNADMHLKNFSMLDRPGIGYSLAPAYDLVATALVNPSDTEELALTINGKKRNIRRSDFDAALERASIDPKVAASLFARFERAIPPWLSFLKNSFLPPRYKKQLRALILDRAAQIDMKLPAR